MEGISAFRQVLYESISILSDQCLSADGSVAQGIAEVLDRMIRKEVYVNYCLINTMMNDEWWMMNDDDDW